MFFLKKKNKTMNEIVRTSADSNINKINGQRNVKLFQEI